MNNYAHIALVLAAMPVVSMAQTLETSIVTDWETVSHYGSQEETLNKINAAVNYADALFNNQLDLYIDVTHVDIPQTESDDTLANHTHPEFLMDSLFEYRIDNEEHINADLTILLTTRKLSTGSTDYVGYAKIGSICSAASLVIVSLYDNGLDGQTLAHEIAHVLSAVHDGEYPCEDTSPRGYLMSSATHTGNDNLSQCSIDTINDAIENKGYCLFDSVSTEPPVVVTPPERSGGKGSVGIIFLLILSIVVVSAQSTRTD